MASDRWRWLGDLLAEQLMGLTPLRSLVIDNDQLVLTADVITGKDPVKRRFRLCADQGTIRVDHCDAEESLLLPMDPNIQINAARLQGGQLVLNGQATVSTLSNSAACKNREQQGDAIEDHRWGEQETIDAIEDAAMAR